MNIKEISTWKNKFGLLPIHLFDKTIDPKSYIMLNGGIGDFCIKTEIDLASPEEYNSISWSSNTKNFITIGEEKINLYNWKKEKPESISVKQVEENFDKFYQYLVKNSYKSSQDVVPAIIEVFKQFRNLTQEKDNAVEALNLLFLLLVNLECDLSDINLNDWGFSDNIYIPENLQSYTDKVKRFIPTIKPRLDLIIRHSAGLLFQEAQKEVLFFDRQIDFWGGFSSKLQAKNILYSSIHYTPPYLSRAVVENSINKLDLQKPKLKIFDPACGSSEFLVEALKQLQEREYSGLIEVIGWDSSLTAISTSNFLLTYEKNKIWKEKLSFTIKLVTDSLTEDWDTDYDAILMNPPFVSWEQMESRFRDSVNHVLGSVFTGRPNQASAFFYKSVMSLNNDGVIGCVMPSSLLVLDSYRKMREEMQECFAIDLIGKLGNFIFEDALTDVSIIIGHKPQNNSVPLILWTRNEKGIAQNALRDLRKMQYNNTTQKIEKDYSIYYPNSFPIAKESWKTVSYQESELLKDIERFVLEKRLGRVQDIFSVLQGIRTGKNDIFKLTKDQFDLLPQNEKHFFKLIIDNDSIRNGRLLDSKYVWFPYSSLNGDFLLNTEEEAKEQAPVFYRDYLKPNKASLSKRVRVPKWWNVSDRAPRLFPLKANLVSTEFGRSDSFAFDKDGTYVVERGNVWLPKKDFKNPDVFYFYLSVFSSPFFDKLLSIYSKQLAGGNWYDLGKKHTAAIPIPNAHSMEVQSSQAFNQLVEIGKDLSEGNVHLKSVLDDIVIGYFYPQK